MTRILHLKFLLLFVFLGTGVSAQSIRSITDLPKLYDTLEVQTDLLPHPIRFNKTGSNQSWDFHELSAPYVYQMILQRPQKGKAGYQFSRADHMIKSPEGYEIYTQTRNDRFEIIGYHDYDFMKSQVSKSSYFDKPYPIKRVPMHMGDSGRDTYRLYMPIANSDIPSDMLKLLPYTPDSARYVMTIQRRYNLNAAGQLDLHVDQYDVLKEDVTEVRTRKLEVKSESIPWQDVTSLFVGSDLFATDSIKKVLFWSENLKSPVAELFLDPTTEQVLKVNFTSHPYLNSAVKIKNVKQDLFASPNPTLGKLRFDMINLNPGFYVLELIDLLGIKVWEQRYYVNQNKSVKEDFSDMMKGTYFYRLKDEQGKTITTKRLIILKP